MNFAVGNLFHGQIRPNAISLILLLFIAIAVTDAADNGAVDFGMVSYASAQDTEDDNAKPSLQNSTAKLRVKPSPMAQQIGQAVQWQPDLEKAVEESRASGKPIFWYISTVPRTFMDRKTEIDRYMLAGPFSWPSIVQRLNEHFVPLKAKPSREQAEQFSLTTYDFVEPGFIVLDADQEIVQRVDQLTTLHPAWLAQLIGRGVKDIPAYESSLVTSAKQGTQLHQAWEQFARDPRLPIALPDSFSDSGEEIEFKMLLGMQQYYSGDHQKANETWKDAIVANRNSPLAAKCAAEREGFGPFVRGFEVHDILPEMAWSAGSKSRGSAAPTDTYDEDELWSRSAELLIRLQRKDGAIIDSDYDFGGTDSLPNVHVAVTALAGSALLHALDRGITDQQTQHRVLKAIELARNYVVDDAHLNPADRDEIMWACAYRLRFLCDLRQRKIEVAEEDFQRCTQSLENVQSKRGNWYHEYQNSFVTATALLALKNAENSQIQVAEKKVELGLEALMRDRYSNGAFPYYSVRRALPADAEGDLVEAAGRMPICELALWQWQKSNDSSLVNAIRTSIQHYPKLRVAYKYDNHTSTLSYGGFFFWFDLQSRAEAISHVQDKELRTAFAEDLRKEILRLPEIDGRFVDSHELGRCYGTAMALISLGILPNEADDQQNDTEH